MKIPHKSKDKKDKIKKKEKIKPKKEQVLVVAQEIKFARLLSGNEKKSRDKVLKTLKKWLLNCFEKKYEFKEDDFVRMWKGLFYAVWMSDKPLVQEELCENISAVLDLFPPEQLKHALLMYKAGLRVLATEWYGVDHHRMDKFLMLVRRYLRASLRCLLRSQWTLESCKLYAEVTSGSDGIYSIKTPKYARNATSMILHIMDCYLEEIAKVSLGDIPPTSLAELLRPVCAYMCHGASPALLCGARRVLSALLRQSEPALRYQSAARAWGAQGCPPGGPQALELVLDEDDESEDGDGEDAEGDSASERPLDPRAGRVDVELALLPVPDNLLANMLRDMLATTTSKAHRRIRIYIERFEKLSRNEYPLTIKTDIEEDKPTREVKPKKVAHSLHVLEKKLVTASDELALRGLSRKHRKRLLAKSRSGMSIVEDVEAVRQKISNATNGAWKVESTEPEPKKSKQNTSNEHNKKRKNEEKDARLLKKRKIDKRNSEVTDNRHRQSDNKLRDNINPIKTNTKINNKITSGEKVSKVQVIGVGKSKKNGEIKPSKENNKKDKKKPEKITLNENSNSDTLKVKNKLDKNTLNFKPPSVLVNKLKVANKFQKQAVKPNVSANRSFETPKKVKFILKNNSMQAPVDYYKSIRQSPNIPFDGKKKPNKTNLKPSTPSPINPFFKKNL